MSETQAGPVAEVGEEQTLLAASVHGILRERILTGELQPGASLSVPAFAAELGVSRSPVREAVQQLIVEGVAVHVPYAGAKVARIGEADIRAVFLVRNELDGLAAAEASMKASAADVEALRALLAQQDERLAEQPDTATDRMLDTHFHAAIRDAAGNKHLADALERIDVLTHLFRSEMWASDDNRRIAQREHHRIFQAIEQGDPVEARAAAQAHVSGLLHRMARAQGTA